MSSLGRQKQLAFIEKFLGTWDTVERKPSYPGSDGYERKGVLTQTMGPGGQSHLIKYVIGNPEVLAGFETLTFDPARNVFMGYAFNDQGPGAFVTEGNWEGDTLVFRGQVQVNGQLIQIRKILTDITPSSYAIRVYGTFPGGPEMLYLETLLSLKPLSQ